MAKAVATPDAPRCPWCHEERLVERDPRTGDLFCAVCGRTWRDDG
jgi:hypothetical protein